MKNIFKGVIAIAIGGTIFTFSQTDLIRNFSKETGLSQEVAKQYVESVKEEDLVPYEKLGDDYINGGQEFLNNVRNIDCVNFQYKWESEQLPCEKGRSQLMTFGNDEVALGNAYKVLSSKSASKTDINSVINLIDTVNVDLNFEILKYMLDTQTIDETKKVNLFNKSLLKTALESDS